MGNPLMILLPVVAVILAGVSIAGLWYWWSSGSEEAAEHQEATPANGIQPQVSQPSQPAEPTVGDVFGKFTTATQSWIANIARAASAPPASSASTSGYASATSTSPTSDGEMVEVLRVLRDLADGSLVVEVGGRRYRSLAEIGDPQVRRRFMGNTQALAQFAQVEVSSFPQVTSWPATTPEAVEQSPLPPPGPIQPSPFMPQPASITEVAIPPTGSQEPSGPKTMADEIEELIQLRLRVTPSLMDRSIHLQEGAGGGIRIEVDGRYFDSVAGVTDAEVAAFLQSIIREWEARQ